MSNQKPIPTNEEIVTALGRTGFLLEQDVAEKLGGNAVTGWAFEDPETGTSREIDVHKFLSVHGMETRGSHSYKHYDVSIHLAIECKSYQWPWIVLSKPWDDRFLELPTGTDATVPMQVKLGLDDEYSSEENVFIKEYLGKRRGSAPRAVQLVKLNKKSGGWDATTENIYNDITYPLAKVVDVLSKRFADLDAQFERRRASMQIVIPALVVASPIYSVTRKQGVMQVEEVNHVILERHLQSSTVQGRFKFDILRLDYLQEWHEKTVLGPLRLLADRVGANDFERKLAGL